MKKFILPIIAVTLFASCARKSDDIQNERQIVLTDTVRMQPAVANADTAVTTSAAPVVQAPPRVIYIEREAPTVVRRTTRRAAPAAQPEVIAPVNTPAPVSTSPDVATNNVPAPDPVDVTPIPEPVAKKKGISDAAKGAAIGGIGGAVAGAVIGKNGKGAIIGGVIGAAGGYILGKAKDKKAAQVEYVQN